MDRVVIIGSGAAGLSAAIRLAEENVPSLIVEEMPSWRAQSNMAEGGINAALNTMGQCDTPALHEAETYKAGRFLACREAVRRLTHDAPQIVSALYEWGMSFNLNSNGTIQQRSFGGQTKKRTAFASASTGKQLMYTLSTRARPFEASGMIKRFTGFRFLKLITKESKAKGVLINDIQRNILSYLPASAIIIASGGLNGLFGNATGSMLNTGYVTSSLFADGLPVANMEMIQYHPTTTKLYGKNMLITEAVRGEGGRLYVERNRKKFYFMEEKYPELGNLMPRDVIAREEWQWIKEGIQPYLDMTEIPREISIHKLAGVLEACRDFLDLNPLKEPIPVSPGIHYFMGGLQVNLYHRTVLDNLYAAGEAACQYHGANRLGGNSLLGAIFGGRTAADSAMEDLSGQTSPFRPDEKMLTFAYWLGNKSTGLSIAVLRKALNQILQKSLGIERNEKDMRLGLEQVQELRAQTDGLYDPNATIDENDGFLKSLCLAEAILESALNRKESRGAHTRSDYPEERESYRKTTLAVYKNGKIHISLVPIEGESDEH